MRYHSAHEWFSHTAAKYPDNVAISGPDRSLTYSELEKQSNKLAHYLLAVGVRSADLAVVLAHDRIAVITAMIAVMKAGVVFVPLDLHAPDARLQAIIANLAPSCIIVDSAALAALKRRDLHIDSAAQVICLDARDGSAAPLVDDASFDRTEPVHAALERDHLCYIYYTSGSTGEPKGIAGRLSAIEHFIRWEIDALKLDDTLRSSQLIAPTFDAFLRDVFVPLCCGGTLCIPSEQDVFSSTDKLVDWISAQRISLIHCVPSLLRAILGETGSRGRFAALRYLLLSGERLFPSDVRRVAEVCGDQVQIVNLYGPSETTMTKLYYFVQPSDRDRGFIPIGVAMPETNVLLIDAARKSAAAGKIGELYIQTPFRSLGYYHQPELTSSVFVPNPLTNDPNDIVYRTGDFGRLLDDGTIEFLGRNDQQVKIRGVRVELGEIEKALREFECVKDAVVVDRDDGGNTFLCAYVVLRIEVTIGTLRNFLQQRLPDYLVPSAFVLMESLPRTISGKVDRQKLPEPKQARGQRGAAHVAPRTDLERELAAIWTQALGLAQVGVLDHFFELGGHSLLAMQVLARVKTAFDVDIPLTGLFNAPTIEALAQLIEAALGAGAAPQRPPLAAVPRDQALPLSFIQQRLWFAEQLEPDTAVYNVYVAVEWSGSLDRQALQRALDAVLARHEVLRTAFAVLDAEPVQVVAPALTVPVQVVDLSALPERDPVLMQRVVAELQRPFDLDRHPLLRASLFIQDYQTHTLLLVTHHLVADEQSMELLVNELLRFYRAFVLGQAPAEAPLPIQYANLAYWERQRLTPALLERQLDYWKRQLSDLPQLALAYDRPRPPRRSFRGTKQKLLVSRQVSDMLRQLSIHEEATLFMTLLAAFHLLLYSLTGQEDSVVGTNLSDRSRDETQRLIGVFLNQLVLRSKLAPEMTFRELLRQVRERTLGAYANQDVPFDKVVEALNPERIPGRNPLFQVIFGIRNTPAVNVDVPGAAVRIVPVHSERTNFDLICYMEEADEGLVADLCYDLDVFRASSAARMLRNFDALLGIVAAQPDSTLQAALAELAAIEQQHRQAEEAAIQRSSLEKLRSARRRGVNISEESAVL